MLQKSWSDCIRKEPFAILFISGETWARHLTSFWLKENFFAEQPKEKTLTQNWVSIDLWKQTKFLFFLYVYYHPNQLCYKATGRMAKLPLLEWFWSSEDARNLGRHARNWDSTAEGRQRLMKPGTCILEWLERYHDPAGSKTYFSTDCCCLSIKEERPWTASG